MLKVRMINCVGKISLQNSKQLLGKNFQKISGSRYLCCTMYGNIWSRISNVNEQCLCVDVQLSILLFHNLIIPVLQHSTQVIFGKL